MIFTQLSRKTQVQVIVRLVTTNSDLCKDKNLCSKETSLPLAVVSDQSCKVSSCSQHLNPVKPGTSQAQQLHLVQHPSKPSLCSLQCRYTWVHTLSTALSYSGTASVMVQTLGKCVIIVIELLYQVKY